MFFASQRFQPFQVTRNHNDYYRFSGSSSYERHFKLGGCSNSNDCAIDRSATPLNDTANAHAFLDAAFFVKRISLLGALHYEAQVFFPVEI